MVAPMNAETASEPGQGNVVSAEVATISYSLFRVAGVRLAVPATVVDEICDLGESVALPKAPVHIPGLLSLRGRAVPLLDLRPFLQLSDEAEQDADDAEFRQRLVVVTAAGMRVGIICDRVFGIVTVGTDVLREPEVTRGQRLGDFASKEWHRTDGLVVVLDIAELLEAARLQKSKG